MKNTELLKPGGWTDYELIDCGGYEKLERFGDFVLARPEPQAVWNKSLPQGTWEARADAYFRRDKRSEERGEWVPRKGMPGQWTVRYCCGGRDLRFRLGLTSFKHVGLFPEQAGNWDYIYERVREAGGADRPDSSGTGGAERSPQTGAPVRVLNLFAYTGGATLAACCAGAEVTHVDSVRPVVGWARENMEASGLDGVRWIVDDALKFVRREVKRERTYQGIVLDPPAYGRGAGGEKWVLEENINEMLTLCGRLLDPERGFLVLNLYSMGLSALLARTAVRQLVGACSREQFGELYFDDTFGKSLPLGVYYRCQR